MTYDALNRIAKAKIENTLDNAAFFYKGHIYDESMNSIGYIPDLAYLVSDIAGMDEEEAYDYCIYLQSTLYDMVLKHYKDEKEFYQKYADVLKFELLDYLVQKKGQK